MLTRMRGLVVAVAASLATIAAGLAPTVAQAASSGSSPAPAVTHYTGTPGVARLVPRTKPAVTTPLVTHPRGARQLPNGHFSAAESVPSAPAAAGAAGAAATNDELSPGQLQRRQQPGQPVHQLQREFEPPDQGLCEGNGLRPRAGQLRVPHLPHDRASRCAGRSTSTTCSTRAARSSPATRAAGTTRDHQTWFATILFLNDTVHRRARSTIAVRHSPRPDGLWTEYQIDTTDPGGHGCPCFGDQPRIGIDQTNLYVTTDEFSIHGPQFNGAQIYASPRRTWSAGSRRAHFVHFADLNIGGTLAGAPQPALSTGKPNAEYFLSSLDPNGTGDNRIGVWAMTNRDRVGHGRHARR